MGGCPLFGRARHPRDRDFLYTPDTWVIVNDLL